MCNYVVVISFV